MLFYFFFFYSHYSFICSFFLKLYSSIIQTLSVFQLSYVSLEVNEVYILLVDDESWPAVAEKWARVNRPMPSNTIGVPNKEQMSSPVTLGDHRISAVIDKCKEKRKKNGIIRMWEYELNFVFCFVVYLITVSTSFYCSVVSSGPIGPRFICLSLSLSSCDFPLKFCVRCFVIESVTKPNRQRHLTADSNGKASDKARPK